MSPILLASPAEPGGQTAPASLGPQLLQPPAQHDLMTSTEGGHKGHADGTGWVSMQDDGDDSHPLTSHAGPCVTQRLHALCKATPGSPMLETCTALGAQPVPPPPPDFTVKAWPPAPAPVTVGLGD